MPYGILELVDQSSIDPDKTLNDKSLLYTAIETSNGEPCVTFDTYNKSFFFNG